MANINMKRGSTSLIIQEICIKTTVKYYYIPMKVAIFTKKKKIDSTKFWREYKENIHTLLVGIQNGTATLENGLTIFFKGKHTFSIYP